MQATENINHQRETQRNFERGTGASGIVFFVGFFSILWMIFFAVTDWIYDTKESRVQASWEDHLNKTRKGINLIDRGPGDYQVDCRPGFSQRCS